MNIKNKFTIAISTLIIVITLIMIALSQFRIREAIETGVHDDADTLKSSMVDMLTLTDDLMMARVKSTMAYFSNEISRRGTVAQGENVIVNALNVPDLMLDQEGQANNFELVDEIARIAGGTATLFSKKGSDFVRVATNVIVNEQRAIGTLLKSDGAVITNINKGLPFYGQVDILGRPYLTAYTPLKNETNDTIGIAYVGYRIDLSELESSIKKSRMLENGFVAILDDQSRISMHSEHITKDAITDVLSKKDGWTLYTEPFDAWGYSIVVAVKNNDVTRIVSKELLLIVTEWLVAGALIITLVIALLNMIITTPLNKTIIKLTDITQGGGDLTRTLGITSDDEFGRLGKELDHLLEKVRKTISDFSVTGNKITYSTERLSEISQSAEHSSVAQHQQVDQIAAAIHEMSMTAHAIASNAVDAEKVSNSVYELTTSANNTLIKLVSSIERQRDKSSESADVVNALNTASRDISTVLNVIKQVSDQTNLLALNAAIEAARAGEHGRGFAVVASEVRSLAAKTQSSTDEIQSMITKLENGVSVVSAFLSSQRSLSEENAASAEESVQSLIKVVDASKKINDINADIASAAEEQSVVTEDISKRVDDIKHEAEQSALYASQTQASATELRGFTDEADKLLAQYRY